MSIFECKAYACVNKNQEILEESSSGGVFTVLAEEIISRGGIVFGALYNDKLEVEHGYADNLQKLQQFRGSKYVQSRIGGSYKQAQSFLEQQREVLFVGTPCQIAGLRGYLGKDYSGLYCVELLCHGVPSPKVWKEYVAWLESTYQQRVVDYKFRYKADAWGTNCKFIFEDQTAVVEAWERNIYFDSFNQNLFLRPSCYDCKFRDEASVADMNIGDYWGIQEEHPDFYGPKGVSTVIIKTDQGRELFHKVKDKLECMETLVKKISRHNPYLLKPSRYNHARDLFFHELKQNKADITQLMRKYLAPFPGADKIRLGIWGSYSSRKLYHTAKNHLPLELAYQFPKSSIISVMSEEGEASKLSPQGNDYSGQATRNDIQKEFRLHISDYAGKADYLLIDLLGERLDLAKIGNTYVTISDGFEDILQQLSYKRIDRQSRELEFLWKEKAREFADAIKEHYPTAHIILLKLYLCEVIKDETQYYPYRERDKIREINALLESYYRFLEQSLQGAHVIEAEAARDFYTDSDFSYGCHPYHYNRELYEQLADRLCRILVKSEVGS